MNRRHALVALGAAPLLFARPSSAARLATVKPLPFKPGALKGLSKGLIESHHQRNYAGAVKKLNAANARLARLPVDTPGFVRGALRQKALTFRNSVLFHELYFGNLGPGGKAPTRALNLDKNFGSLAQFEAELKRTALTQAGGSGWTIMGLDLSSGELMLQVAANHSQGPAQFVPLLVMDMYEHSYALDYGADAARYVEAFYRNIDWTVVGRRYAGAVRAKQVLAAQ